MRRSALENSSGGSGPQSNATISQAVPAYLATLSPEERAASTQVLNGLTRWFGAQRTLNSMTPPDLERYQEQLAAEARTDLPQRLEIARAFLSYAKRQKWTERNLAVEIKLKRKAAGGKKGSVASSAPAEGEPIRLTPEGYEKLAKELEYLETTVRAQVAMELRKAAADKDFRENAPYDVAKQHQGEVEARIRELKRTLQTGEVVRVERSSVADLGSTVTVKDLEEDEEIVYTLVGPGEIDTRRNRISIQSPVGKALSGKGAGDEVEVEVPAGMIRLRVEKVEHRR